MCMAEASTFNLSWLVCSGLAGRLRFHKWFSVGYFLQVHVGCDFYGQRVWEHFSCRAPEEGFEVGAMRGWRREAWGVLATVIARWSDQPHTDAYICKTCIKTFSESGARATLTEKEQVLKDGSDSHVSFCFKGYTFRSEAGPCHIPKHSTLHRIRKHDEAHPPHPAIGLYLQHIFRLSGPYL